NHLVTIDDVRSSSPFSFPPTRTDRQGRATFDRLASGDYRVGTSMTARCNNSQPVSVIRTVRLGGNGVSRARLVLGGQAAVRVLSSFGPVGGAPVAVTPGRGEHIEARMRFMPGMRMMLSSSCGGSTNADGLVTFTNIPSGPFTVEVRRGNSTFVSHVDFRGDGRETSILIPEGLLSLRVVNAVDGRPIANARVTWSGAGYRVMATATGNGEVLLEGVGEGAGSVGVYAPGFVEGTAQVAPASAPIEIAVAPLPRSLRQVRVVTRSGEPIEHAIVELFPPTVLDIGVIAVTDANGTIAFNSVPPRDTRARVSADGYLPAAITLGADSDTSLVVALAAAPR
ncbi:MAG: carboxypeptidase regulatory-like domain-containing protein, partial [Vicinamibacterales bacterium]